MTGERGLVGEREHEEEKRGRQSARRGTKKDFSRNSQCHLGRTVRIGVLPTWQRIASSRHQLK